MREFRAVRCLHPTKKLPRRCDESPAKERIHSGLLSLMDRGQALAKKNDVDGSKSQKVDNGSHKVNHSSHNSKVLILQQFVNNPSCGEAIS